ncbi:hypothetical protein ZHAS_00007366 [Anopheles sinensis]|uniref:Uncharacterized protein n=1 Tax=Anopheles sinensis TaxID=74873 RepID=A0A084VPT5_ANOSI|nr:hypothetical protein ZHAS_00007366 [Anopheles sinensis]
MCVGFASGKQPTPWRSERGYSTRHHDAFQPLANVCLHHPPPPPPSLCLGAAVCCVCPESYRSELLVVLELA